MSTRPEPEIPRRSARTTARPNVPANGLVKLPWHADAAVALATHRIVVFVGVPGSGKTEFVQHLCRKSTDHFAEELQGGPKVDDLGFFGRYTLAGDETLFVDGPLSRALKNGSWFVLNDAGQVPFAQISALLPLRHGDTLVNPISQEVLTVPEGFRLVLTMNRENSSCRNNLTAMESLLDGALVVDVPEPGEAEIRAILAAKLPGIDRVMLDRLLAIRNRFADLANKEGERQKVNVGVRAMLQLATLLQAGLGELAAVRQAIVGKFLLHKDKYDAAQLTNELA